MPAHGTECIDYTPAKLIYAATGSLKEASEKSGIGYSAVRVAAHRQDWKTEVSTAVEMVKQNVTMAMGAQRLSMQQRSESVREKLEWNIGDAKGMGRDEIASLLKPFVGTTDPIWVEAFLYPGKGTNRAMRRVKVTLA